jgi:quercetin dioxygenase-like cupin family protein
MSPQIVWSLQPADRGSFSGDAHTHLVAAAERDVPLKLYYVRFEPGARTHWHTHSGTQILVVCSGRCRYQIAGNAVRELAAGESVRFDAGVRHWHGAVDDQAAEHIAINLDGRETEWLETVSDSEYRPNASS